MTIEQLLAQHEIQRALTEFARGMDERSWAKLATILTEDAVGDYGEGRLASGAAIIATLRHYLDSCGPTQHLLGNLIVDVDGETARSRCYVSDMHIGAGGRSDLTYVTLSDYHDRWRKIDGRWRMVERIKHMHAAIGSLEVFAGMGRPPGGKEL